jgi:malate dehydrogenase (quinone)
MNNTKHLYDIALIGSGIMSATLGALLKQVMPEANIVLFERLPTIAHESSMAWNNAGTGHSAFCELNYTPQNEQGEIDISKAIKIAEQFEVSKQFWTYLVKTKLLANPQQFIQPIPHCSVVFGENDIDFLKKRFQLLLKQPLFEGMHYQEDWEKITEWMPLVANGQSNDSNKMACTKMEMGTDVNFGELSKQLISILQHDANCEVYLNHHVHDIDNNDNDTWEIEVENLANGITRKVDAKFVFVGAGGGALRLLNKAKISEVDGYGGFPVGGKWLRCKNETVINQHHAKVYGKADIGAPPMSVPHLDTRFIDGKKELLFGPYAGFNTKFLKEGSFWDLPSSIDFDNVLPMLQAGLHNMPLTKYLIDQVLMSFDEKFEALQRYYPLANKDDWELIEAGQRVQVIKKNENGDGEIEFGTELIATQKGTICGLLGASPGASTAVSIMLNCIEKCFKNEFIQNDWASKIQAMIPSYQIHLNENEELLKQVRNDSAKWLGIK